MEEARDDYLRKEDNDIRLDAVTTAGNLALRDRFSTPQNNNNNSNNNDAIVESPRDPDNGTFREVNLLNDSAA